MLYLKYKEVDFSPTSTTKHTHLANGEVQVRASKRYLKATQIVCGRYKGRTCVFLLLVYCSFYLHLNASHGKSKLSIVEKGIKKERDRERERERDRGQS